MAHLFDLPNRQNDPDGLPEPSDEYRAFAPPSPHPHFMLMFVFPNGSMTGYRFSDLGRMDFTPAPADGLDVLNLHFACAWAKTAVTVRIEGENLLQLCCYVGEQQTRWLRVLPPGCQAKDPATPVITRIVLPPGEI